MSFQGFQGSFVNNPVYGVLEIGYDESVDMLYGISILEPFMSFITFIS